jgi:hypothetical protein
MPFVSLIVVNAPIAIGNILIKIVASFSSNLAIVCFNCDDQTRHPGTTYAVQPSRPAANGRLRQRFFAQVLHTSTRKRNPDRAEREEGNRETRSLRVSDERSDSTDRRDKMRARIPRLSGAIRTKTGQSLFA